MELPDYYEFCCRVNIVAGHLVLEQLPRMLAELNACKPMIITDEGVMAAGLADIVLNALDDNVSRGPVDDDVPPDSDLHTVHRLAHLYRDAGCDAIIAVGGGSVIDTAKGVNMVVSENVSSILELAGAGSLKRKFMDALSHAVEAYTCLAKNPLSDAYSLSAIELISRNIERVILHPEDKQARLAMASAACMAGIAFSNSMVGMVHTLGHTVGSVSHVPHGVCMAILLPYGLEYNMHKISDQTAQLLLPLAGSEICAKTPKHLQARAVIDSIRSLNQRLHDATDGRHPCAFKEVRDSQGHNLVHRSQLEAIATKALNDASIFLNPEELDYEDCLTVLEAAYKGKPLDI